MRLRSTALVIVAVVAAVAALVAGAVLTHVRAAQRWLWVYALFLILAISFTGLLGVVSGLRGRTGGTFEGVALYAEWTTDPEDWATYERVWRGHTVP